MNPSGSTGGMAIAAILGAVVLAAFIFLIFWLITHREQKISAVLSKKEISSLKVMQNFDIKTVPQYTFYFQIPDKTLKFIVSENIFSAAEEGKTYFITYKGSELRDMR